MGTLFLYFAITGANVPTWGRAVLGTLGVLCIICVLIGIASVCVDGYQIGPCVKTQKMRKHKSKKHTKTKRSKNIK